MTEICYATEVPRQVIIEIFEHLSIYDLVAASQVCKQWKSYSESPTLWTDERGKTDVYFFTDRELVLMRNILSRKKLEEKKDRTVL